MIKAASLAATAVLSLLVAALPARAADVGTAEEAIAIVNHVKQEIESDGLDKAIADINAKTFNSKDLYPFLYDSKGVNLAHGANPALVGKSLIDLKDQSGKFMIREIVATAASGKPGWVNYKWPNPTTNKIDDKSAYIDSAKGVAIGVGIYGVK